MSLLLVFPSELILKTRKTFIEPLKFGSYAGKILPFNVFIAFSW